MTDTSPPPPEVEAPNQSVFRNLSLVWLVPVIGLVVSLLVAWQAYSERGTLIDIRFENGAGITPGETTLQFRDVVIGEVEDIRFGANLDTVIVRVRVRNEVLPYLDDDAAFWVVRPEISARGVTGLSTVVSGVYIEGAWDAVPETGVRDFTGLESPPFLRPGEEGTEITLQVPAGIKLQGGAPILLRGIAVGRLDTPRLSNSGQAIIARGFIESPFDQNLAEGTRFWDASGVSFGFGSGGLSVNIESLAALLSGGVAFDQIYEDGAALGAGSVFQVYASEEAAIASAFSRPVDGEVPVTIQLDSYNPGLRPGLQVRATGRPVGHVSESYVRSFDTASGPVRRQVAVLLLDPVALGLTEGADSEEVYDYLAEEVDRGLRARVSSAGLIASELRIDLAMVRNPDTAVFDRDADPFARVPMTSAPASSLNSTAENLMDRVAELPFEEFLLQATDTLASIESLAADADLRQISSEAISLLTDARELLGNENTRALPGTAFGAVDELRAILAELRESGSVAALTAALSRVDTIMDPVAQASARLPEIVDNLTTLSETAAALEIEALVTSARAVLASADTFLSNEGLEDVPAALVASLDELELLLASLREADVAEGLGSTMASVETAADGLPPLVARTEAVLAEIQALSASYGPRSDLMTEAMDVLREITVAARSISQLARTIERNPNSLIRGR
ncbi:intermembrane transport protein PqiB [Tropicimonas sp. S265A]|uniref:PqiB family protein n=1 Tax=Tropicimonas sp. S265A TaxID=3415134 RepID=UPI003C7C6F58